MLKESLLGFGGLNFSAGQRYLLDHQYAYVAETDRTPDSYLQKTLQLYAWAHDVTGDINNWEDVIYTLEENPSVYGNCYHGATVNNQQVILQGTSLISGRSVANNTITINGDRVYYRSSSLDKVDTVSFTEYKKHVFPVPLDGSSTNKSFTFNFTSMNVRTDNIFPMQAWFDFNTQKIIVLSYYRSGQTATADYTRMLIQSYHPVTGDLLDEHLTDGLSSEDFNSSYTEDIVVNTTRGCYSFLLNGGHQNGSTGIKPKICFYFPRYNAFYEVDLNNYVPTNNKHNMILSSLGHCYMNYDGTWRAEPLIYTYSTDSSTSSWRQLTRLVIEQGSVISTPIEIYDSGNFISLGYYSGTFDKYPPVRVTGPINDYYYYFSYDNTLIPAGIIALTNGSTYSIYGYYTDYGVSGENGTISYYKTGLPSGYNSNRGHKRILLEQNQFIASYPDSINNQNGHLPYVGSISLNGSGTYPSTTWDTINLVDGCRDTSIYLLKGPSHCEKDPSWEYSPWYIIYDSFVQLEYPNNSGKMDVYHIHDVYEAGGNTLITRTTNNISLYTALDNSKWGAFSWNNYDYCEGRNVTSLRIVDSYSAVNSKKDLRYTNIFRSTLSGLDVYSLDLYNNTAFAGYTSNVSTSNYPIICMGDGETTTPYRTVTIVPTPSDSTVKISSGGLLKEGTTFQIPEGSQVNYQVSRANYTTATGTITVNGDVTENINLAALGQLVTLSITPQPADATVTLTSDNVPTVSGTGTQSIEVVAGASVTYTVSKSSFTTKTATTIVNSNLSMNVAIEAPLTQVYSKTSAGTFSYTVPSQYNYVEITFAGAGGAPCTHNNIGTPGKGAVRKITTKLTNRTITGNIGAKANYSSGGSGYQSGGGGHALNYHNHYSGGGGGSTSVVTNNSTATAGGGSGVALIARMKSAGSSSSYHYYTANSGAGGGPNGGAAIILDSNSFNYAKEYNSANGTVEGSTKYYNGKNATNSDAIGYNSGTGYVTIKAGWKSQYA